MGLLDSLGGVLKGAFGEAEAAALLSRSATA